MKILIGSGDINCNYKVYEKKTFYRIVLLWILGFKVYLNIGKKCLFLMVGTPL